MSDTTPTLPPPRREPVLNLPGVVIACIAVLVALYALYAFASDATQDWAIATFAFVPARLAIALGLAQDQLRDAVQELPQDTFTMLIGSGSARWWTLLTYALMHGSWAHVGFNCLWLAVFGAPVARRFGAPRFLLLLALAAIAGALVQFLAAMASFVPVVGASAAIAGAMGAATRFVFRPSGEASPLFRAEQLDAAFRLPALSLAEMVRTRAALLFIVFWFVTNLLFGLFPNLTGVSDGPIAWPAHIGGFLTGLFAFPLLDPRRKPTGLEPEVSADVPMSEQGISGDGSAAEPRPPF